jgi:nicotinamide mononucleotide transporter
MEDQSVWNAIGEAAGQLPQLEVAAVVAGLVYVILAARENIWCWPFGILNSILSIYLFVQAKLYAESFLYLYYVAAGVYGWYAWRHREAGTDLQVSHRSWGFHGRWIATGVVLSLGLALVLDRFSDAQQPLIDAHTTIFSFIATYLVTRKVLENWIYWIIIDAVSIWLYSNRGLYLYAGLMIIYTILAIWGFWSWWKTLQEQESQGIRPMA